MIEEGADIIDVGGESSRPGSEPVSAEEELRRVIPVIRGICYTRHSGASRNPEPPDGLDPGFRRGDGASRGPVLISIDTTKSVVAREAVAAGAGMINDISAGTFDKDMFKVAAGAKVPICLMHMRGAPKTMQTGDIHYKDVCGDIADYLKGRIDKALDAGIDPKDIIVDPGIGFGKTVEHNVAILQGLKRIKELNYPILIGTSRKSFLGALTGVKEPKDRLYASLASLAVAYRNGAEIFRVHDVGASREFLRIIFSISTSFRRKPESRADR